jgi:hypothetical protein
MRIALWMFFSATAVAADLPAPQIQGDQLHCKAARAWVDAVGDLDADTVAPTPYTPAREVFDLGPEGWESIKAQGKTVLQLCDLIEGDWEHRNASKCKSLSSSVAGGMYQTFCEAYLAPVAHTCRGAGAWSDACNKARDLGLAESEELHQDFLESNRTDAPSCSGTASDEYTAAMCKAVSRRSNSDCGAFSSSSDEHKLCDAIAAKKSDECLRWAKRVHDIGFRYFEHFCAAWID